jgi:ABC-type multidrug transport system ATPase subunit
MIKRQVTSMFEIETKNLTKNFGALVAVSNLNLQIARGTIFGFLGPNGAGK